MAGRPEVERRLLAVARERSFQTVEDPLAGKRSVRLGGGLTVGKGGNEANGRAGPGSAGEQRVTAGNVDAGASVLDGAEANNRESW